LLWTLVLSSLTLERYYSSVSNSISTLRHSEYRDVGLAFEKCLRFDRRRETSLVIPDTTVLGRMAGLFVLVVLVVLPCLPRAYADNALAESEKSSLDDPSIENPDRPPVIDDRPGVFNMTARQALKAIEEVNNGSVDCKTMLAERSLKLLYFKYENSVYTDQANVAIRSANLVSDLIPSGSAKSLNLTGESVLREHKQVLYSIVRNNLETDPLIVGSAIIFDNNSYINYSFYAPYAYRNTNDSFIKVTDLSATWSYLHEAFVKLMRMKSSNRSFPTRSTYFYPRSLNDKGVTLTHRFVESIDGLWSRPYFECSTLRAWVITYTSPILGNWNKNGPVSFM